MLHYSSLFISIGCSALCSFLLDAKNSCWPGQGSNRILEWLLVVVGLGPGSQLWNQTHSFLGLVCLVHATKQGALHRVSLAVASLGLVSGPGFLHAALQTCSMLEPSS
jgi:hypothetical protein